MKYVLLITPEDKIEIKEYVEYHTLNELVDGWYERCGCFAVADKLCMLFCNEEFLFQDNCAFNAIGTTLAGQPIYGNVVVTEDGYNDEDERDALPFNYNDAQKICDILNDLRIIIAPVLNDLNAKYKDNKPEPTFEVSAMSEKEFCEALGIENDEL